MPIYLYDCSGCGEFDSTERADSLVHDCGRTARRRWKLRIDARSARHEGRWDPKVGQYVSSEREFRSLIRQGAERESESLGVDVKLEMVDSRDQQALSELHREPLAQREETIERSNVARRAEQTK